MFNSTQNKTVTTVSTTYMSHIYTYIYLNINIIIGMKNARTGQCLDVDAPLGGVKPESRQRALLTKGLHLVGLVFLFGGFCCMRRICGWTDVSTYSITIRTWQVTTSKPSQWLVHHVARPSNPADQIKMKIHLLSNKVYMGSPGRCIKVN